MNIDLFIFTALLLSRNIYMKYVGYSKFHGSSSVWYSLRKRPTPTEIKKATCTEFFEKSFALNFAFVLLLLLGIFVGWRLFSLNSFHNFLCLFYP